MTARDGPGAASRTSRWPSALGRALPRRFRRRVATVDPGAVHPFDEDEWRDSLVLIERGEIELECSLGGRRRFRQGDVLWLVGLSLRRIHNHGDVPAVLVAISRSDAAHLPPGARVVHRDEPERR